MNDNQMIPEAAVEAAARAMSIHTMVNASPENEKFREAVRVEARRTLEAAEPHMLAEAITTVGGLSALTGGAVILSGEGGVFEAIEAWDRDESEHGIQWMETGSSWRRESHEIALPATVLHRPTP